MTNATDAAYDAEVDRNQNRAANERASDVVYVRPQSTARMHHPFVDMEAGCSDDDDNAYSDNDGWSTMISGELCDDERGLYRDLLRRYQRGRRLCY